MASRISQLLSAFGSALGDASVTLLESRNALAETGKIPRVTHVPLGGDVLPPDMVGEGKIIATDGTQVRDRIIAVRSFNLAMYCQGVNKEVTEQLLHNAIAAWYFACSGSVSFSQEVWTDQQEGADDKVRRGHVVSLIVNLMIPVYATAKPLVRLTGWTEDGMMTPKGTLYGTVSSYGTGSKYSPGEIVC